MKVYDFDRTLFPGDSSIHFWKYCIKRFPKVLLVIPSATVAIIRYKLGRCNWEYVTQKFFAFLKYLPSAAQTVEDFWDEKSDKIYPWFFDVRTEDDVIISAAPQFLIEPIARRLGVHCIATDMDINTGIIYNGECSGEEKLFRFRSRFSNAEIDEFYSDSHSDVPLARAAERAFMIFDGEVRDWDFSTN